MLELLAIVILLPIAVLLGLKFGQNWKVMAGGLLIAYGLIAVAVLITMFTPDGIDRVYSCGNTVCSRAEKETFSLVRSQRREIAVTGEIKVGAAKQFRKVLGDAST